MRVAILSYNAQAGDAIGNNVAEKLLFFRERAADVRVFVESDQRLHPNVKDHCYPVDADALQYLTNQTGEAWHFISSADLVCAEIGQYYSPLSVLPLLADGKPRVVLDYHGITPPELWGTHNREALIKGLQHRGLAWLADITLTHSCFTQNELLEVTGLAPQRLPRLGFPVDCSFWATGPSREECRSALGWHEKNVLLFVGRLAANKRPTLLVEALRHLMEMTAPVHAVFVGDASDIYETEARRCLDLASQLGLTDRVHVLGPKVGNQLRDCYRAADVLVVPSQWESFCIPVIEAMAAGLPVIAARTSALHETVASAGLTFVPDDAADLARQLRRVLASSPNPTLAPQEVIREKAIPRFKIAVVASRFGSNFVSGAEVSLRRMALALLEAGNDVEIFTTCTRSETGGTNDLLQGRSVDRGLYVHRFPVDRGLGHALEHGIQSQALLANLGERITEFTHLITGPYLAPLTAAVVERWPEKTIVVPCFHDEPAARQEPWAARYDRVAGVLYHSPEEQSFAETVLGINHPGSTVVGTQIDATQLGDAKRGRELAGAENYVVYCGRYAEGKNLPLLLDWARKFDADYPGRLRFVFTGQGEVSIPRVPWAVDLGFVTQDALRDVLSGAAALVQLSRNESLSLAALQAWGQGTPVIAHEQCAVLAGHIERGAGGILVGNFDEFVVALENLLPSPPLGEVSSVSQELRQRLGAAGQQYVREHFGSGEAFQRCLTLALREFQTPLAERMRQRGLERAARFDRALWRKEFGALIESVLHAEPRQLREIFLVQPRGKHCSARVGVEAVLVPVRVSNRGNLAAVAQGPGRTVIAGRVVDAEGRVVGHLDPPTPLPALLMPGRTMAASVIVRVPQTAGSYEVRLWACRVDHLGDEPVHESSLQLAVVGNEELTQDEGQGAGLILDEVQTAILEAHRVRQLPDNYHDITQGAFAGLKWHVKQKLLGNFKKAYVDVLSRQQSACNQQLLAAVGALTECCATLDHTVRMLQDKVARLEKAKKQQETVRQRDKETGRQGDRELTAIHP